MRLRAIWPLTSGATGRRLVSLQKAALVTAIVAATSSCEPNVYVSNVNGISAYSADTSTGALTPVSGSPFPTNGNAPQGLALTANYLYVANSGSSNVSGFHIDGTTGALTPVPGSPFGAGAGPCCIGIDSSGSFLYAINRNSGDISAYNINPGTGALSPIANSPFPSPRPLSIALELVGEFARYAYVGSIRGIYVYSIDAGTGALTPIPGNPFGAAVVTTGAVSLAIHPSGHMLYALNPDQYALDNIVGLAIDCGTGALSPLTGNIYGAPQSPEGFAMDASGRFLYASYDPSPTVPFDVIAGFNINGQTGDFTVIPGSPFHISGHPGAITIDPSGFLYVADSNGIFGYSMDPSTGTLSPVPNSPFSPGSGGGITTTAATPRAISCVTD